MTNINNAIDFDFLKSAFSDGACISTSDALEWLKEQNEKVSYRLSQVSLDNIEGWSRTNDSIKHISGKFFSIDGVKIQTNYGQVESWEQPIINQPEIGFLGIIVKKINGIYHFLMQAKIEPGNINIVQLSPTLQATRSNYTRVHQGKAPLFLDYFNGEKKVRILVDQLQSEQGARFLHKRNRNIIIEVSKDEIPNPPSNFVWLTLKQLKEMLNCPNVVNMDTRTVISCIQFGSYSERDLNLLSAANLLGYYGNLYESSLYSVLNNDNHLHSIQEILHWITSLKFKYELNVNIIPLAEVKDWEYDGMEIYHKDRKYFSVIGVKVEIGNREVVSWSQPMVKPAQSGIMGFLVKKINGIYHFLVQAKLEPGNFDVLEMAPTVQCLTGNYRKGLNEYTIPYIEYFTNPDPKNVWYSVNQSEEGGRFYKEENMNMIVEVGDEFPIEVEENYCWLTLNQLLSFVEYNNYLNIASRSLISAIRFA